MHRKRAFTLIELLIVVAIIGILAAIAVPNFLNAQTRAKASKSFSEIRMLYDQNVIRHMDTGLWVVDGDDAGKGPAELCALDRGFFGKTCDDARIKPPGCWNGAHSGGIFSLLTSPVAYLNEIPVDPFANGLFYGFTDGGCSNLKSGPHAGLYWVFYAAGPDKDVADWIISAAARFDDKGGAAYNPSNGLHSNGDIWKVHKLRIGGQVRGNTFF